MDGINQGSFYFVLDSFYRDFPDTKLMSNREPSGGQHNRPCYYSIEGELPGVFWLIPISSQVEKYRRIYDQKLERYRSVDTIVFGYVLGKERAFLIQNMFPVTRNYIMNEYIDNVTKKPVVINDKLKKELRGKAEKVLGMHRKGIPLIFPDVIE